MGDNDSLLKSDHALLRLRRDTPTLKIGTLELIRMDESILFYKRITKDQTLFIALNFGDKIAIFETPTDHQRIIFTVGMSPTPISPVTQIPPNVGTIFGTGITEHARHFLRPI